MSNKAPTAKETPSHSSEANIMEARKAHASRIRERGENPFSNQVESLSNIRDLIEMVSAARTSSEYDPPRYDAERVAQLASHSGPRIAGRIVAKRSFGKATFLRMRDRTGEIQLLCKQNSLGAMYQRLSEGEIDVADIAVAEGTMMVTKTGELSIEASSLSLLTKAYRPLPEKFHGLQDTEIRYRQRYVDLISNVDVADVFRARSVIVRALRTYLDRDGFLEVDTPSLVTLVGGATAKPFHTHHNALDLSLFMRIAPELFLKRCLVGGFDRVYEIARCYRNEGISTRHNPEFSMIEFYKAYATYHDLMAMTESILFFVDRELALALPKQHKEWAEDRPFTLGEPFARVTMRDATLRGLKETGVDDFLKASELGISALFELFNAERKNRTKSWAAASKRAIDWANFNAGFGKCDNDGERLFCLYEYFAEPFLAEDYRSADGTKSKPVFVIDHPFEISPLARRKDTDSTLTDRFELFIEGRELCNAFSELNDPEDQAARFQEQVAKKSRGAEETMDYDEDYVRALEHGMPPAAGFGMGIDRLTMMLCNQASIRDVILFPLLRPEARK